MNEAASPRRAPARRRAQARLAAALAAVLLATCAKNPATGRRELVLIGEGQEIAMGREASEQVDAQLGLYPDAGLQDYVSGLGLRMARASERPELPWKVAVVDSPVVNAFALPGGFVYLTRGILAYMNNEAAMVGVLGHEIGHVTARHSVRQLSRAQLAGLGLGLGTVFFPEVRPFGDVLQGSLGLLFLKFSRDDEREADELGVRYALALGYDADEMAGFFRVLARLGERSGQSIPSWLSTHPDPTDRERRIRELVAQTRGAARGLAVREEEYKRRLEGLVYGENPREGFVDGRRFKHPDLRFQIDFPDGWAVQNTRQAVYAAPRGGEAAVQLTASRVAPGTSPEAHGRRFFRTHGIEHGTGERVRIHGFAAYRAPFRLRTERGVLAGEAGFLVDGETAYEILGLTTTSAYRRFRGVFLSVIDSFDRLRDPEALAVEPLRIALYETPRAMSLREALAAAGVDPALYDELAIVNDRRLDERVEPGALLKVVVGEPLARRDRP